MQRAVLVPLRTGFQRGCSVRRQQYAASVLPSPTALRPTGCRHDSRRSSDRRHVRTFHISAVRAKQQSDGADTWSSDKVNSYAGHNFPDFVEHWTHRSFYNVGYGLSGATVAMGAMAAVASPTWILPTAVTGAATALYWKVGLQDMRQNSHAIRRNFPVLGNMRYIFETVRPEIHQYFIESDVDGRPYERLRRALIYQRAKGVDDTIPFGTRRDLYEINAEWACHSMYPKQAEANPRHTIGNPAYGTIEPYHASVLNISAMSYGSLGDNAILALNNGARMGSFYHNTGEGGISQSHINGGGDIVWNIGTGYFGCGVTDDNGIRRFDADVMRETLNETNGRVKMIEIKISQGAKPGHGGILPKAKITQDIANARKLEYPAKDDCHSPASHSEFFSPPELVQFIAKVREVSGGLPVGVKFCVGDPGEIARLVRTVKEMGNGPDFITVDGAEGGTGAAPPEFSNSIGMPLEEGLVLVRNLLVGAGLKDQISIIASGRVTSGFSLVRTMALGADVANAARAFMMSLGCIQALKCNTNKCPTGIATQDKKLQFGLDPTDKKHRVFNFHQRTVKAAQEIVGTIGHERFAEVSSNDIMRRIRHAKVRTLSEHFPPVEPGCLLDGTGPQRLQELWDAAIDGPHRTGKEDGVGGVDRRGDQRHQKRWIYE